MRVLMSVYGSRGDIAPLVALAVRLRELGAEARVCAPPDEEFADLLAGAGVPLVPFGRTARTDVPEGTPPPAHPLGRAVEFAAAQFSATLAAADGCDVVLAAGVMPAGVRSVAEKRGLRYVYACFQPGTLPSPHHPPPLMPGQAFPPGMTGNLARWDRDARGVDDLFGAELNAQRASIGLPPVRNVRDHAYTSHPWLAADPLLGPWQETADLDVVQTGAWILPDQRPLPDQLTAFLDAGPPPVYVGFGSMLLRYTKDMAAIAIEAVRAQGRRVLISRGWGGLAPIDDRDDCLAVGEVNQQALFRRVAAVVHHGGAGTTTTAAQAGAPQVVVPQMADQPYWAKRVAALGIGAAHAGPAPTTWSLSAALKTALSPQTQARAAAVAGEIRTDGTTVAATLLTAAASREAALSRGGSDEGAEAG